MVVLGWDHASDAVEQLGVVVRTGLVNALEHDFLSRVAGAQLHVLLLVYHCFRDCARVLWLHYLFTI